jgi:hypothetical protein
LAAGRPLPAAHGIGSAAVRLPTALLPFDRRPALGQRVVIAQAQLEGLLLGGVVARECERLGFPVVVPGQYLDDDRAAGGAVDHAPTPLRRAGGGDRVVGAIAGAVAGGDGVSHALLLSR